MRGALAEQEGKEHRPSALENSHAQNALRDEKARREDAEKRAAQAAADLAKFASVKQEPRGIGVRD